MCVCLTCCYRITNEIAFENALIAAAPATGWFHGDDDDDDDDDNNVDDDDDDDDNEGDDHDDDDDDDDLHHDDHWCHPPQLHDSSSGANPPPLPTIQWLATTSHPMEDCRNGRERLWDMMRAEVY